MEMNAYKDFHIFACMSVIKTCVTGLVLKDKNAQHWKSFSFILQITLMSLWQFFKNPKPIKDFNSLWYFSHNLKILILKMMVVLWILNSLTSLANFSFSLNLLETCPWWYATFIFLFFFVLIKSSYRLIISAASSGYCTSSASLFQFSNSVTWSMIIESNNCFFISSFDRRLAFLLSAIPFHIYKQKLITLVPNLKQKCLSKLIFFCKFRSKKLPQEFFFFF